MQLQSQEPVPAPDPMAFANYTNVPLINCMGDLFGSLDQMVEISGRVARRFSRFIKLRDHFGTIQLVAPDARVDLLFKSILEESHIVVVGKLCLRPKRNRTTEGPRISLTDVEIQVADILHVEAPPPGTITVVEQQPNREVTATEYNKCGGAPAVVEAFRNRQWTCGELRRQHNNQTVRLIGWVDGNKRHTRFMNFHDGHGCVQVVLSLTIPGLIEAFNKIPPTALVSIEGTIKLRPQQARRPAMETGDVELYILSFEVLDTTTPPAQEEVQQNQQHITVSPMTVPTPAPAPSTSRPASSEAIKTPRCIVTPVAKVQRQQQRQYSQVKIPRNVNSFTNRTHTCGELRTEHIGQNVKLVGWLEFERMKKFLTIRDGYGSIQVIIPPQMVDEIKLDEVPFESIIEIEGCVVARPDKLENTSMLTGNVEVTMTNFKVLNVSKKNLPIEVRDFNRPKETLRLENRYIDLRYPDMQRNLRIRSSVLMKMREYLINDCGFVEVETPTLFRKTPGVS